MSIGILALIFALACGLLTIYGVQQQPDRKPPTTDYTRIFQAVTPKDL